MNDIIEFDADGRSLLQAMRTAKVFLDRFTTEYDFYREQVLKLVEGHACEIFHRGVKVATVAVSAPKRFNTEAFKADHPHLYASYLVPGSPVTRLTLTKAIQVSPAYLEVDE